MHQNNSIKFSHKLKQQLCRFSDFNLREQANRIKQKLIADKAAIEHQLNHLNPDTLTKQEANDLLVFMDKLEMDTHCLLAPVRHLHGVAQTPEIRSAYQELLPLLSDYATWLSQHEKLYQIFLSIAKADYFNGFSQPRQADIERSVRDFELSGVGLPEDKKQRLQKINQGLSRLTTDFSNHVLDATQSWHKHLGDKDELAGLEDNHLAYLHDKAKEKNLSGYLITLDWPAYHAIMHYAENRELRKEVYIAFATRASDQADNLAYDNTEIMNEILALRHETARLLNSNNTSHNSFNNSNFNNAYNFNSYADYALQTRMANSVSEVMTFLYDLADASLTKAKQEFSALKAFTAKASDQAINSPEPWDIAYYSEKLKQSLFQLSPEQLRPYFPLEGVLEGMRTIVERLFGIQLSDITDQIDLYHKDVRFLLLHNGDAPVGGIYLDLFAREGKNGGAWMDEYISHCRLDETLHLPVAFLTTNFTPPTADKPALLLHEEVETLLHELGHTLHHVLTQIDVLGTAGINNVAWDAVELPSQLLENWCWEKEGLELLAGHYQTHEPIPEAWIDQLLAAKQFQSGMQTLRQVELGTFDMLIHSTYPGGSSDSSNFIHHSLTKAREKVRVTPVYKHDRFAHGFSHIFAGGYAAGYYSYKWAEVLSADVFLAFRNGASLIERQANLF